MEPALPAGPFLKAEFRIGSVHGQQSYKMHERVFHPTDVPAKARQAKEEVRKSLLNGVLMHERPPWNAQSDSGVDVSFRRGCAWDPASAATAASPVAMTALRASQGERVTLASAVKMATVGLERAESRELAALDALDRNERKTAERQAQAELIRTLSRSRPLLVQTMQEQWNASTTLDPRALKVGNIFPPDAPSSASTPSSSAPAASPASPSAPLARSAALATAALPPCRPTAVPAEHVSLLERHRLEQEAIRVAKATRRERERRQEVQSHAMQIAAFNKAWNQYPLDPHASASTASDWAAHSTAAQEVDGQDGASLVPMLRAAGGFALALRNPQVMEEVRRSLAERYNADTFQSYLDRVDQAVEGENSGAPDATGRLSHGAGGLTQRSRNQRDPARGAIARTVAAWATGEAVPPRLRHLFACPGVPRRTTAFGSSTSEAPTTGGGGSGSGAGPDASFSPPSSSSAAASGGSASPAASSALAITSSGPNARVLERGSKGQVRSVPLVAGAPASLSAFLAPQMTDLEALGLPAFDSNNPVERDGFTPRVPGPSATSATAALTPAPSPLGAAGTAALGSSAGPGAGSVHRVLPPPRRRGPAPKSMSEIYAAIAQPLSLPGAGGGGRSRHPLWAGHGVRERAQQVRERHLRKARAHAGPALAAAIDRELGESSGSGAGMGAGSEDAQAAKARTAAAHRTLPLHRQVDVRAVDVMQGYVDPTTGVDIDSDDEEQEATRHGHAAAAGDTGHEWSADA